MNSRLFALVCFLLLGAGTSAWATPIMFDFVHTPSGSVKSNHYTIEEDGFSLTAYGFNANNTNRKLFWKNSRSKGIDVRGLGVVSTRRHELTLTGRGSRIANYIQLDVSQIYQTFADGHIQMQGVTGSQAFDLYGSNTLGVIGTKILSGNNTNNGFINIPDWGSYKYVSVAVSPQGSKHKYDDVLIGAMGVGNGDWAEPVTFDFEHKPSGPVRSDHWSVTEDELTLTAYGFNADNTPRGLYWKNTGPNDRGLGVVKTSHHKLTLASKGTAIANYIQLDVSLIYQVLTNGQIEMQSVTKGEKFDLYGSDTLGDIGTKILSGCDAHNVFVDIPYWGDYAYISVAVTPQGKKHRHDDILFSAFRGIPLSITSPPDIPEPATLSILVLGGLALLKRKKR